MECEVKDAWKCFFVEFSIWAALYMLVDFFVVHLPEHIPIYMAAIAGTATTSIFVLAQAIKFSRIVRNIVEEAKKEAVRDE